MYQFFLGWRRKVGCFTLVLAIVVMVAWIRSYCFYDEVTPYQGSEHFLISMRGRVAWGRVTPSNPLNLAGLQSFSMINMNMQDTRDIWDLHVCWRWAGFRFESGTLKHQASRVEIETWMVPYWSLVLPLTLISGYSILRQPLPSQVQSAVHD